MITLDTILKDTMWVGKFYDGDRIAGTYAELEPIMDEFRDFNIRCDFDISCGQPPHLEKFYEDFYAYSCKNGWCTVQDYYNNVYVKEVA